MRLTAGSGLGGGGIRSSDGEAEFIIYGDVYFLPEWYPNTFRVRKARELDRTSDFCHGEDVTDTGSENRELHIVGYMLHSNKDTFDDLVESGEPHEVSSTTRSSEAFVKEGEYEGPVLYHPPTGQHIYEYTLDLVETGRDEEAQAAANGIVSDGTD